MSKKLEPKKLDPKKLNLNNNFVNKLNAIMKQKLNRNSKKSKSTSYLKKSTTSYLTKSTISPPALPKIMPFPDISLDSKLSPESSTQDSNEIIFKKVILKEMTDIGLMWESFDDSIKKIVINEIIEKYYFYKNWKLNTISFFLGILCTFLIILLSKILQFNKKKLMCDYIKQNDRTY